MDLQLLLLLSVWPLLFGCPQQINNNSFSTVCDKLYMYDLSYTKTLSPAGEYEETMLVATLAGLVNRKAPRLFTPFLPADDYWWEFLKKRNFPPSINERNCLVPLPDLDALLQAFPSFWSHGAILFDPMVPATRNVAQTAAGVWDLLPVAYRPEDPASLYTRYVQSGHLPVNFTLVGLFSYKDWKTSTGSAKGDAYMWAIDTFLGHSLQTTGRRSHKNAKHERPLANPTMLGYFVDYYWTQVPTGSGAQGAAGSYDLHTVSNHDYFVESLLLRFNVWADVTPNDDPEQAMGMDRLTLEAILRSCYELTGGEKMITVGGFTPWVFKYVGWEHQGVETEWETVKLLSRYNAMLDADACCVGAMAKAAFYQHYPLPERLVQQPAPAPETLARKG